MRTMMMTAFAVVGAVLLMSGAAPATELTFRFLNPSFGGDPLLGNFLLNKADAQRDLDLPDTDDLLGTNLDDFTLGINRLLQTRLQSQIVAEATGQENGRLPPDGEYDLGDIRYTVQRGADDLVTVTIVDVLTGDVRVVSFTSIPFAGS